MDVLLKMRNEREICLRGGLAYEMKGLISLK